MSPLLLFAIASTIFMATGLLASLVLSRDSRAIAQRVLQIAQRGAQNQSRAHKKEELQKKIFAAVRWIRSRLGINENTRLREQLARAGYGKNPSHMDLYVSARVLAPLAAIGIGSFVPSNRFSWMLALAGFAYLAPDIVLKRMVKRRREKIRKSMPDAIDLLVVCVDAGLGMDQAMLRVGQELSASHPEINEEFLQINREQRAGKPRIEAWQAMAERSQLQDVAAFVNMLMQTERFGTPVA